MKEVEKYELPYIEGESDKITFKTISVDVYDTDGNVTQESRSVPVKEDGGQVYTFLYLFHEIRTETDENGDTEEKTYAMQIKVAKPLSRGKAISAAEAAAYNLRTAEEIASYGTSLARKARLGEDTDEITEHDEFIADVKECLTKIGI